MAEGTGIIVCSTSVVRCMYAAEIYWGIIQATSNYIYIVFNSESHDLDLKNHIFSIYHSFWLVTMIINMNKRLLSICTWFLRISILWNIKFDELDFFPILIFAGYKGSKNPVQTGEKNPFHLTWNFKLENVKNQVPIDRGIMWLNIISLAP